MSELNGDKARFQRLRKAGLRRRERARAVLAAIKRRAAANRTALDSQQFGGVRGRIGTLHLEEHQALSE